MSCGLPSRVPKPSSKPVREGATHLTVGAVRPRRSVRAELADKLAADKSLFKSVKQPGGSPFFAQNGLLFLSTEQLTGITKSLTRSARLPARPVEQRAIVIVDRGGCDANTENDNLHKAIKEWCI
jgi:hypothetical protein